MDSKQIEFLAAEFDTLNIKSSKKLGDFIQFLKGQKLNKTVSVLEKFNPEMEISVDYSLWKPSGYMSNTLTFMVSHGKKTTPKIVNGERGVVIDIGDGFITIVILEVLDYELTLEVLKNKGN